MRDGGAYEVRLSRPEADHVAGAHGRGCGPEPRFAGVVAAAQAERRRVDVGRQEREVRVESRFRGRRADLAVPLATPMT